MGFFFPLSLIFLQVLFRLLEGAQEEGKIHSLNEVIALQPGVVRVVLVSQGDHCPRAQHGLHTEIVPHRSAPSRDQTGASWPCSPRQDFRHRAGNLAFIRSGFREQLFSGT